MKSTKEQREVWLKCDQPLETSERIKVLISDIEELEAEDKKLKDVRILMEVELWKIQNNDARKNEIWDQYDLIRDTARDAIKQVKQIMGEE